MAFFFLCFVMAAAGESPAVSSPSVAPSPVASPAPIAVATSWELCWDDQIDGVVQPASKRCHLRLTEIDGHISGSFDGLVLGQERTATFMGQSLGLNGAVVTLQQHEPGYVCAYQLQRVSPDSLKGVWHDTVGRQGDVTLKRKPNKAVGTGSERAPVRVRTGSGENSSVLAR